jgi:thiamine-phosphate pyrophosphorylase
MIARLHYITQDIENKSHQQLAEEACLAGADWIQLRVKNRPYEEWKKIAEETLRICRKHGAKLIINDNVQLASEIGADGVHLGKEDMSTAEARKVLGKNFIIGGTANTFGDVKMHVRAGVDYVGVGPFRFTITKDKLSPILGSDGYKRILEQCASENISVPVIAIGGITVQDVSEIIKTGVHGIAVAGAITHAEDKTQVISDFRLVLNSPPGRRL